MKNKKDSKKEIINEKNEIKNLVLLVLCVTIIFFMFYGLTLLIMKKDNGIKNTNKIDFNQILISHLLNQPDKNYYVLVTIENDQNNNTYDSLKEEYYKKEGHKTIYNANLNDPLNKLFVGDTTSLEGNILDFRFDKSTLVEIEDGIVKGIYEGSTDILAKLNDIK